MLDQRRRLSFRGTQGTLVQTARDILAVDNMASGEAIIIGVSDNRFSPPLGSGMGVVVSLVLWGLLIWAVWQWLAS
jgi:hypothetical protein